MVADLADLADLRLGTQIVAVSQKAWAATRTSPLTSAHHRSSKFPEETVAEKMPLSHASLGHQLVSRTKQHSRGRAGVCRNDLPTVFCASDSV